MKDLLYASYYNLLGKLQLASLPRSDDDCLSQYVAAIWGENGNHGGPPELHSV